MIYNININIILRIKINKIGVVYTPDEISNYMIDNLNINLNDKILEPSVGTGNFIISLLKYIKNKFNLNNIELYNWFVKKVDCYDIDNNAINILKKRLNIFNEDSLFKDLDKDKNTRMKK